LSVDFSLEKVGRQAAIYLFVDYKHKLASYLYLST